VVQWFWLQDVFPDYDQFNRVHEMLLSQWKRIRKQRIADDTLTLTCTGGYEEDVVTTQYLRDVAMQAGCRTQFLDVGRIGWDDENRCFVDEEEQPITSMFKLYPWEWLFDEEFGDYLLVNPFRCIVEPPWKALLSCKALLPVLWELFPNHPNLLPASFEPGQMQGAYVSKPIFGREGQGIIIYDGDQRIESLVQETTMPRIYQAYAPLTLFGERYPMIGSWVVGERAAGIGIREAPTLITDNEAFFAPHCIEA
jgi:glutathionylspermidine synthase